VGCSLQSWQEAILPEKSKILVRKAIFRSTGCTIPITTLDLTNCSAVHSEIVPSILRRPDLQFSRKEAAEALLNWPPVPGNSGLIEWFDRIVE